MTAMGRFDMDLPELLTEVAAGPDPDYLEDVLQRTAASAQRRTLASVERQLRVDPVTPRPAPERRPGIDRRLLAAVVALLLALVGLIALTSGRRELPAPFGIAANGVIAYAQDGDILGVDPVTGRTRTLLGGDTIDGFPVFAPRGDRFSFFRETSDGPVLFVADDRGQHPLRLGGPFPAIDAFEWSPDGTQIAVAWRDGGSDVIDLVATDGSGTTRLDVGFDAQQVSWRPPDGRSLVFRGRGGAGPDLWMVRADGTDLRRLGVADERVTTDERAQSAVAWAPDGSRISFNSVGLTPAGRAEMRTMVLEIDDAGAVRSTKRLVFDPANADEGWAIWSPDGSRFLLNVARADDSFMRVAIADSDGSGPLVIVGPPTTTRQAMERRWSPDGRQVMLRYWEEQQAWLIDAATGSGDQVPHWATSPDAPSWQRRSP